MLMKIDNEILRLLMRSGALIELTTAIIGSIYINKYKETPLKFFIILLWYTSINEILVIFHFREISKFNSLTYNIYNVINFTYLFFLFKYYLSNRKNKVLVTIFLIMYLLVFLINGFFENYLTDFQRLPYILAALFLIITIVLYFIEVLNSEKVLFANKSLIFWISVGLLIYFVGIIPFRFLRNYYEYLTDATIYFLVIFSLTVIMNICFIIGFIWSNKKQPY